MTLAPAPTLETERLRLRAYKIEDFEAFAALYQSDRSEYMNGPIDRTAAWVRFAAGAGRWLLLGYGPWAIIRKEDNMCVGIVSLNPPIGGQEKELGWALWDGFTGHGYAFEAATRALRFAVDELGWTDFVSYISEPNAPSIKLAKRLGAVFDADATKAKQGNTHVYRHNYTQALKNTQ